jgi:alpha-N-arabinofuranosidase
MTLDTFNRHADKVAMANVAQLINCLHSPFIAHEDKFTVTPTFHVFEMYVPHQGAQAVRAEFVSSPAKYIRNDKPASFWGLGGSASLKGKQLTLTAVNPDISSPRETEIAVRGARIGSATARVLSATDVHAHNTLDIPRAVEPRDESINLAGGRLVYQFAPASVTRLQFTLV